MIQLYINGKLCDIDDEFDIKLEKDFDNTNIHVIEESEYSFEIDLPVTKRNREAFGFVDAFDVANKFGTVYDAVLNADESNVLVGKFILEEIENDTYSGNLYVPKKKTLKDVLGDKKMKDIKEHMMYISTWNDIKAINDNIIFNNTNTDRHIAFPYILYRLPYNYTGSTLPTTTQDLSASGSSFSLDTVFPAYNVLSVIKDIFASEGYNIQGNVFGLEKFTELYQTFGGTSANDYVSSRSVPYYMKFGWQYCNRWAAYGDRQENTSSTLLTTSLFSEPLMEVGADAILLSDNTIFNYEDDDYNMLVKGTNSDARTIVIPQSGWYEIKCDGTIDYPAQNGTWGQDGRVNIDGCYNDADRVDMSQNMIEFQIKKTSTPLQSINYYSFNMSTPMIPTNLSKENLIETQLDEGSWIVRMLYRTMNAKLSYEESRNKFAKNGKTAIVKDYSGFDTSEFLAGARFGCVWNSLMVDEDRTPDKRAPEMAFTCLPDPSKAKGGIYTDPATNLVTPLMPLYTYLGLRRSDGDDFRYDYGSQTAQILVRDDSYSNFEGYNRFTPPTQQGVDGTWQTDAYEKREYAGQSNSYATMINDKMGSFTINTCVWLEKGDNISLELVMPNNNYRDECGWWEISCDWKNRDREGIIMTRCSGNFEIGIVSTQKDWIPTETNPIPTYADVRTPKQTNVNQWLGDTKVNDYIENFLNTFNLKLTRLNSTTYSIDTMSNENDTYGNIIDIDKWANVKDAKFTRLNSKNTKLEWTISTDEEGYVHGNNTRENKTKRDESGYTGSISFINDADTSSDEEKVKSNWSYTWEKDITFVNGDVVFESGVREVPVIGDAEIWDQTYISVKDKDFATDKTPRLIYMDKDPLTSLVDYFNVHGYKNDSTIDEVKAPLLFCKNYIVTKNNMSGFKTFRLDYNNELSTKDDKTITDIFYNIKKGSQYEVDVPVTLPNSIYESIRANTLVKFNDALFKVMGIEGHNVTMSDAATLKLITLN